MTHTINSTPHQPERGHPPAEAIVIGALGTNTLKLARETLGAHPYLTVPAHMRYARETLGSNAFLAPEHKAVLTEDDGEARKIGRPESLPRLAQPVDIRVRIQRVDTA